MNAPLLRDQLGDDVRKQHPRTAFAPLQAAPPEPSRAARRQPKVPALIEALPRGLVECDSVEQVIQRVVHLLDGRPFTLHLQSAAMAGFDTLPIVTIKAAGTGPGWWLCAAILGDFDSLEADMATLTDALVKAGATPFSR